MSYVYDEKFMNYTSQTSRYAASRIVALLNPVLAPTSVLDVGCAVGTWLAVWQRAGVANVHGVDGDYVEKSRLEVPRDLFSPVDLSGPLWLGRRFDLVQSLEVAEHVPHSSSATFVDNLVRHADRYVLFSAAPPGQGGEFHINEQEYEFWRRLFAQHGFAAFDFVRPRIANDQAISFWYRYNILLFVRDSAVASLPQAVAAAYVAPEQHIADISSLAFQLRKLLVRLLPPGAQNGVARLRSRLSSRGSPPDR